MKRERTCEKEIKRGMHLQKSALLAVFERQQMFSFTGILLYLSPDCIKIGIVVWKEIETHTREDIETLKQQVKKI